MFDHLPDHFVEEFKHPLARMRAEHLAEGIDQDEGRPSPDCVLLPHPHAGVVHDGMLDPVPQDGLADSLVIFLRVELGRMDTDHNQFTAVFPFEAFKVL